MPKDQVKNYHCDRCGQCFTNKADKYRHEVARHNLHDGPTILNCSQCATTFKRLSDMIRHKAKYHVQSSTPLSDIPRNRDHPTSSSLGDYTIPKKKKRATPSCRVSRHPDTRCRDEILQVSTETQHAAISQRRPPTSLLVPRKDIPEAEHHPVPLELPVTFMSPSTFGKDPRTHPMPSLSNVSTPSTVGPDWAEKVFCPDDPPTDDPGNHQLTDAGPYITFDKPAATSSPAKQDIPEETVMPPDRPDLNATLDMLHPVRTPEVPQNLGHFLGAQPRLPAAPTSMDVEYRCYRAGASMFARNCPFTIEQVAASFRTHILQPCLDFELNAIRTNRDIPVAAPPS